MKEEKKLKDILEILGNRKIFLFDKHAPANAKSFRQMLGQGGAF
jgi:hypothetical protein